MASPQRARWLSPSEGYRVWAGTYDREANPMLSLEQRILGTLLPSIAGLDVVDLGCGTGRWLDALRGASARSLIGVDPSPEMLSYARAKLGDAATFVCEEYGNVLIPVASADLVLCNFVLSYVEDAEAFLKVARNILRPGGSLFLTDVHPDTATALNWRRGVHMESGFEEICTYPRSFAEVMELCTNVGSDVSLRLEPKFGQEERAIFDENGKGDYFEEVREHPAIYILQLRKPPATKISITETAQIGVVAQLRGARLALNGTESFRGTVQIDKSRLETMISDVNEDSAPPPSESGVDLHGYLLLPGLINAHDHLEFALFPRLGRGGYRNFMEWAEDIHRVHAAEIAFHRQVPKEARLWWGGIRNVLCGVTTVCHHNPFECEVFSEEFIVRVLEDYEWAHSLQLEPAAAMKKRKTPKGRPFFIHLAEGLDTQSEKEIFHLCSRGALDADTVVIHGLGLNAKGKTMLRASGAGLVWCPSSNLFLFGKSLSAEEIRQFPRVALGSDSPLTADGDLLDEVRCAHQLLQAPAEALYTCVTRKPAQILALKNGEGAIRIGSVADLIAVRDNGLTPADTLATLSYRDVELVLLAGRVQLASPDLRKRLPPSACAGLQPLSIEGVVRWVRAPLKRLFEEAQAYLGDKLYLGGRRISLASQN
jgi:cytosine/adenosine deaminase-related metal-dependent hydrolase/ubiquinone/menaquinone biosynthesis C-methylase UbiE